MAAQKLMRKVITFETKFKDFILDSFDKTVDNEGYVVEKKSSKRVITLDGSELKKEDFAGVREGSEVYIKSDLLSLIELCDALYNKNELSG